MAVKKCHSRLPAQHRFTFTQPTASLVPQRAQIFAIESSEPSVRPVCFYLFRPGEATHRTTKHHRRLTPLRFHLTAGASKLRRMLPVRCGRKPMSRAAASRSLPDI